MVPGSGVQGHGVGRGQYVKMFWFNNISVVEIKSCNVKCGTMSMVSWCLIVKYIAHGIGGSWGFLLVGEGV